MSMPVMERLLVVIVVQLLATVHLQYLDKYERCTSDGEICLELKDCKELHVPVRKGFRPKVCRFNGTSEIVCCSTQVEQDLNFRISEQPLSEKMCLNYLGNICPSFTKFVLGGTKAAPKELPFMVLIGYGRIGSIEWLCGGTLISNNFVLSAAHCTKSELMGVASWVRLGELDTSTKTDDAKTLDLRIVERINHPNYKASQYYNDIALFRLHREVEFSDYIRPICLYQSDSLDWHKKVVAAGWGNTEKGSASSALLKVDLELYDMTFCSHHEKSRIQLPTGLKRDSQICSGFINGSRDTCNGDSGGPLFLPSIKGQSGSCVLYTQIGVTSFGPRICGQVNSPGVYTKISAFRDWIESVVWKDASDEGPIWAT